MTNTPEIRNPEKRYDSIVQVVEDRKDKLSPLLPSHMDWDRGVALLKAALSSTPLLLDCTNISIYQSLERCYKLGLEPNGPLGEAYILPFRDNKSGNYTATAIIGYKGWLKLAYQSGGLKRISARCVYKHEVESGAVEISLEPPSVRHSVDLLSSRKLEDSDIVAAYAVFELSNGGKVVSVLTRDTLDKLERCSKQGWKSNSKFPTRYAGMARKSAILSAFNKREVPISSEVVAQALAAESEMDNLQPAEWEEPKAPSLAAPAITGPEEFVSTHAGQRVKQQDVEIPPQPEPFGEKASDIPF